MFICVMVSCVSVVKVVVLLKLCVVSIVLCIDDMKVLVLFVVEFCRCNWFCVVFFFSVIVS